MTSHRREFGEAGRAFGPGPWEAEPGRVEWRHRGVPCLLRRSRLGVWCGYAAVAPGHPLHGAFYGDVAVEVHGGLTYGAPCDGAEGIGICHVPEPGEPGDVWWFGFDCSHAFDLIPAWAADPGLADLEFPGAAYRDLPYARAEVERLADQLLALAETGS